MLLPHRFTDIDHKDQASETASNCQSSCLENLFVECRGKSYVFIGLSKDPCICFLSIESVFSSYQTCLLLVYL